MTDRIMLDERATARIDVAGAEFMKLVAELIGPTLPEGIGGVAFATSLAVQACLRGMLRGDHARNDERAQYVMLAGAEGVGAIVGLVPDQDQRAALFHQCVQAMSMSINAQALIHTPAGNT